MQFSEFAQKLYPILGGSNTQDFVEELFKNILDDDLSNDAKNTLLNYDSSTFRAWYYGPNQITFFARKIHKHLNYANFEEYLNTVSDDAVENICMAFEEDIPGIEPLNAREKLSQFFGAIIIEASYNKRKPPKDKPPGSDNCLASFNVDDVKAPLIQVSPSKGRINLEPHDYHLLPEKYRGVTRSEYKYQKEANKINKTKKKRKPRRKEKPQQS